MTPYPVFRADIEPKGFKTILMPGRVTEHVVGRVNELIKDKSKKEKMVEHNFQLGKKYLSYDWVERKLKKILKEMKLTNINHS